MATNNPLDIGHNLNHAWETFTKNAVPLIVGFMLVAIIGGFSMMICMGPMLVGYNRMVLRAVRGESIEVGDVFKGFDTFGPAFVLMFLSVAAIMIGFIFLVIPGIIAAYLLFWSFWFMADGETSATECMRKSSELSRTDIGNGAVFVFLNSLIQGAGNAVPFGAFLTAPIASAMAAEGFQRSVHGAREAHEVESFDAPGQPAQAQAQAQAQDPAQGLQQQPPGQGY